MAKHPYAGRTAALATRHGKQIAIAPPFQVNLDLNVALSDVDTDAFGTFAGDVPRLESPLNTAIAKARAGIDASGYPLGVASEGTLGPDPQIPFINSDLEIVVFVDTERDIVISEFARATNVTAFRASILPNDDLTDLMSRADFPRHGLIVKSKESSPDLLFKGLSNEEELRAALEECFSLTGQAIIESDFRAHHSPSRMAVIASCAEKLAKRVATLCPECSCPGWGSINPDRGLPCSACGTLVESAVRADRDGCPSCSREELTVRQVKFVDPRWCPVCNP